jgi:hypothetical protein
LIETLLLADIDDELENHSDGTLHSWKGTLDIALELFSKKMVRKASSTMVIRPHSALSTKLFSTDVLFKTPIVDMNSKHH